MTTFIWSQPALRDFESIRDYLMTIDPDIYKTLVIQSEAASRFLQEFPSAGSPVGNGSSRKWRIGKFPYLLIYSVNRQSIVVLRVYHERQDWGQDPSESE